MTSAGFVCVFVFVLAHHAYGQSHLTREGCPPGCECPQDNFKYKVTCDTIPDRLPANTTELKCSRANTPKYLLPRDVEPLESVLKSLKTFDMCDANIETIDPSFFSKFNELTVLRMSRNQIRYMRSGLFDGCTKIVEIHLDYNEINTVDDMCFKTLTELKILNLKFNMIKVIPPIPSNLHTLDVSNNKIVSLSPFSDAKALEKLDLCGNPLKEYDEGIIFPDTKNLKSLCIPRVPVSKRDLRSGSITFPLQTFSLNATEPGQELESLPFVKADKLKTLNIIGCDISPVLLRNLTSLEELNLLQSGIIKGSNKNHELLTSVSGLKELEMLNVSHSEEIAHVLLASGDVWQQLTRLGYIGLNSCGISDLAQLQKSRSSTVDRKIDVDIRNNSLSCTCSWKQCFKEDLNIVGNTNETWCIEKNTTITMQLQEYFDYVCKTNKNSTSTSTTTEKIEKKHNMKTKTTPVPPVPEKAGKSWASENKGAVIGIFFVIVLIIAVIFAYVFFHFRRRGDLTLQGSIRKYFRKEQTSRADLVEECPNPTQ